MSDEWCKYQKILDREDEFKRPMEVEVSSSFLSEFSISNLANIEFYLG